MTLVFRLGQHRGLPRSSEKTAIRPRAGRGIAAVTTKLRAVHEHQTVTLLRRTAQDFLADDCPNLAASISYYGLFSLFPLLLGTIAVLGYVARSPSLQSEIVGVVAGYLPGSGELLAANLQRVVQAREEAGIAAILGFLWSAMAVFAAIRKALNAAWDLERSRPFLRQKLLELAMVGAVGTLFVLSIVLTALFRLLRQWQLPFFAFHPFDHAWLWLFVGAVLPWAVTFTLFLLLYRMVPFTKVAWSSAALGAILASVLFELAKNLFVWYTQTFGRYELIYGSLGAVIGMLTWIYLSALILLLGAELGAEHGKLLAQRVPRDEAEQDSR